MPFLKGEQMNACKRIEVIQYKCTSKQWGECDFARRSYGYCDWNNMGFCKNPKAHRDAAAKAIMEEEEE